MTAAALQRAIDIKSETDVTRLAEQIDIDITMPTQDDGRQYSVYVDGKDVTWALRSPEVDTNVSIVSAYPGVREAMVSLQQRIAQQGEVVVVGRDIGTVVLPGAETKIYLEASPEERAQRRYQERVARGEHVDFAEILHDIRRRDEVDSSRKASPLRPAYDAIIVNTDGLSVDQATRHVLDLVDSRQVAK